MLVFTDELADDKEKLFHAVLPLLRNLPPANFAVLGYLMKFLATVAQHCEVNRMTSYNLSIVFGPSLLRPREESIESSLKSPRANLVIQTLITLAQTAFE